MQKLIYILLFSWAFSWAQTATIDPEFKNTYDLYQEGKYEEAVVRYQKLLQSEGESADLHFNLGNAYYKLHQTAPAIYHYEMALLLQPDDIAAQTNLKFAKKTLLDDIPTVRNLGSKEIIHNFFKVLPYDSWAWIGVAAAFLVFCSYMGYYLAQRSGFKRLYFTLMLVFALGGVFALTAAYLEQSYVKNYRTAILFAEKTALKSEAKNTSKTLATLHEGTKVLILEEKSLWTKVKLNNQNTGWILKEDYREIK
ncbi:tetratricopeptide repeat protein [Flavobacterium sp. JP2137]|uniref:tetratricopeptide repeat protein n=1 Tax=Flavobacterium sp. JP2137 TaxID=3414510 RepID=UPI003D3010CD